MSKFSKNILRNRLSGVSTRVCIYVAAQRMHLVLAK